MSAAPSIARANASPVEGTFLGRRYAELFWDCSLSRLERWILPICLVLTMALQVKQILHSALAIPMIGLMATLCWTTPTTGFFYIACAQFLPFPEGVALNPAQIGVVTWIAVSLLRYRRISLAGLSRLWPVVPWLAWFWLITGEAIYEPNSEYVKALLYSVIACHQVNVSGGRHLKCLLGLCLGCLMVTTAFWALQLGFGVDLSTWGGERSGFARLGGVRADAVMIWPPLLMGCFGTLGITLSAMASNRLPGQVSRLKWLTIAAFFISIPPLVATMTHGAYAGFALMTLFVVLAYMDLQRRKLLRSRSASIMPVVATLVGVFAIVYATDLFQTRSRITALYDYYQHTAESSGAAASRSDVWEYAVRTIIQHPLLGVDFNKEPEDIPPEYAPFGGYLSHNVFLDYGRHTGVPGLLLAAFFFLYPFFRLWRRRDNWRFHGFFLFHIALLIFWLSLSFQFYKTFWGFWMLAALVAEREPVALPGREPAGPRTVP